MTLKSTKTGFVESKAVCFHNKENNEISVPVLETIPQPTVDEPIRIKPLLPTIVLTDNEITQTITKDSGLKTVLVTIQESSSQYKTAIPLTVEVQTLNDNINKYVVVLDVNGKKEQKVYTFQKDNETPEHVATTSIPAVITPRRVVQTVVDNQKVTVSNSVEQIEVLYPETKEVIKIAKQDVKDVQSVVVKEESASTDVTVVSTGTNKDLIIKEYTTKDGQITKVDEQTVFIKDVISPKPVIFTPIKPAIVTGNPVLVSEITKVAKIETTKITTVSVSKQTNVEVYEITGVNNEGKEVSVEIVYNPSTDEGSVVDVVEVKNVKPIQTVTETKTITGIVEVVTTNTQTIKESTEFKQISDFLTKNHPDEEIVSATPII